MVELMCFFVALYLVQILLTFLKVTTSFSSNEEKNTMLIPFYGFKEIFK